MATVAVLALPGDVTEDTGRACCGMQQAGEHLEGGGLARAIGAEKTDQFAFLNGEADLIDGEGLFVTAMEEAAHSAAKARLLFVRPKRLG